MRKLLIPIAALTVAVAPMAVHADPACRNAKGQFAKCGTPGSMTLAQYKATKAKSATASAAPVAKPAGAMTATKPAMMAAAKPATPSAKPSAKATGLMAKFKPKPKASPAPASATTTTTKAN